MMSALGQTKWRVFFVVGMFGLIIRSVVKVMYEITHLVWNMQSHDQLFEEFY